MKTPKQVKARKVYFPDHTPTRRGFFQVAYHKPPAYQNPQPVWTVPATKEAYDQMVGQMASAQFDQWCQVFMVDDSWDKAVKRVKDRFLLSTVAALSSIGIERPAK